MDVECELAMRRLTIAAAFAALIIVNAAVPCEGREPYENQWGPFTGTVVDADTGQPIPGAVFTVFWMRSIPLIAHPWVYFYDARVAVADETGHFEIPRRWPALFIETVDLSCIAPEYAPFMDSGAQNAPIMVKLRRWRKPEDIRLGIFDDPRLGVIPDAEASELENVINQGREQMGLRPIRYLNGMYKRN